MLREILINSSNRLYCLRARTRLRLYCSVNLFNATKLLMSNIRVKPAHRSGLENESHGSENTKKH